MLKKILAAAALLFYAALSFAATDVNTATAAELDGVKGIGPAISGRIVEERKKGKFKDWNDFITRVKGVGEATATKFSAEGLTVGGATYKGAAPAPAPAAKPATPAAPAAPATPAAKPAPTPAPAPAPAAKPAPAPAPAAAPSAPKPADKPAAKPAASATPAAPAAPATPASGKKAKEPKAPKEPKPAASAAKK